MKKSAKAPRYPPSKASIERTANFETKPATLLQDVPQNSATQHGGAGLILLGRGKRLLYMGREFAPSGTEVFRNHRKFPAIFTMKKGRMCMVGSNSVPLNYYSCPLPLDHGYHVLKVKNIQ
jgi:hypothetical protein